MKKDPRGIISNRFNNELLDEVIQTKGYTKKHVADQLCVTKSLVSQWTKNRHPSIPKYCELCDLLGLEYDTLLRKI